MVESSLEQFSFEEAFQRLEAAVATLEQGGLTVDDMVARFSEGMALVKQCYEKLDAAQARVSKLLAETEMIGGPEDTPDDSQWEDSDNE